MKLLSLILLAIFGLTACVDTDSVPKTPTPNQQLDLKDQDFDGVINARDLCADTEFGAVIDNDGCPRVIQVEEEERLVTLFANDSIQVLPEYYPEIEDMADFLAKYPDTRLRLRGHASRTGPKEHNIELSEKRAQAVHDLLISKYGVNPDQLEIVWFGDEKPAVEGNSEYDHAQNRRVVGSIVGEYTDSEKEWTIYTSRPRID